MKHARVDAVPEELPDELVYSILLNLPPKTLLRFRTTSRRWNDIITSRTFAKHHCNHSRTKRRAEHLFIHSIHNQDNEIRHYANLYENLSCRGRFQLPLKLFSEKLPKRVKRDGCWFESSSCDGVLCTPRYEAGRTATILVWNPFTRHSRRVPCPVAHTHRAKVRVSFVGIGRDHVTDDYKIVVHTYNFSASASETYVMALKSNVNVWRKIEELSVSWGRKETKPVTMDNGDVYWVSWFINFSGTIGENISQDNYWTCPITQLRFLILKFNFRDECVTIMPSPKDDHHDLGDPRWRGQLGKYEGSLYFIKYYSGSLIGSPHRTHWIHIWKLQAAARDDNGSRKATWVKAMHVPVRLLLGNYDRVVPLGFTIRGDLMMRMNHRATRDDDHGDLIVYFAREGRFVVVRLEDDAEAGSKGVAYDHLLQTESLIFPH